MKDKDKEHPGAHSSTLNEERDSTVSHLLVRLKEMREAVPVNYELKHELKKKLLLQMQQMSKEQIPQIKNNKQKYGWYAALFAIALFAFIAWNQWMPSSVQFNHLEELKSSYAVLDADLSPDGTQAILLANSQLLMFDQKGHQLNRLSLPVRDGEIKQISHSPTGDEVAWTWQRNGASEIWITQISSGGSRLVADLPASAVEGLDWAPDGQKIYAGINGEIWQISTISAVMRKITDGFQPAASPDGKHLAFLRGTEIHIIDPQGKSVWSLQSGRLPKWVSSEQLLYIDSRSESQLMVIHPFDPEQEAREILIDREEDTSIESVDFSADRKKAVITTSSQRGTRIEWGELDVR